MHQHPKLYSSNFHSCKQIYTFLQRWDDASILRYFDCAQYRLSSGQARFGCWFL